MPRAAALDPTPIADDIALSAGVGVLRAEARALERLAAELNGDFTAVVRRLLDVSGRVIVTGMGKSGHVAKKIAATLASTGTPAFFVHPAEASHGDMGMVTREDAVIMLSNSGETAELADLIDYTRRFNLPLVAVTKRAHSTLGRLADHCLLLPDQPEACPLNLAPTTSTTASLALGDALAVALLEARGFTAEQFGVFHPGGKLGQRLLRVRQLMHTGDALPLVGAELTMAQAILTMSEKRLGCVGVIDADGRLIGVVTDGDLRRHMSPDLLQRPVEALMTPQPRTVDGELLAVEALRRMNGDDDGDGARPVTVLFVLDAQGRPQGAIHLHDLLRAGVR